MTGLKVFFSRFFGNKASPVRKSIDWVEKRLNPRIGLSVSDSLAVHLLEPGSGDIGTTLVASVVNVSLRGLGIKLAVKEDQQKVRPGQEMVATVVIDDFSVPLTVEVVRYVGDDGLGVRFKPPFPKELVQLERFLEPRAVGPSMREIRTEALQQGEEKTLRWFQGVNDTHLFTWSNKKDGAVLQQQLIFVDRVVEWGQAIPFRTGRIQKEDESSASGRYGWVRSELLDFDGTPDAEFLHQAQILLQSSWLPSEVRNMFLLKIEEVLNTKDFTV